MANTVNQNLIVPEVYSGLVREKISGYTVMATAAKKIDVLKGNPGETVSFPRWSYLGDAVDIIPGNPMPKTSLKQTSTQATIRMIAAPAVSVNDYDNAVSFGNALDEASKQQAIAMARKLDTDLINCAISTPLKSQPVTANTLEFDDLMNALKLFGDEVDTEDFAFIAIHSLLIPSFVAMPGFVDASNTMVTAGNGIVHNNLLGYWRGIPVVLTDRLYDSKNQEAYSLIIKNRSLGIIPKEEIFIETEREASTRTTTVYCSTYYATALIDESGVVLVKKSAIATE